MKLNHKTSDVSLKEGILASFRVLSNKRYVVIIALLIITIVFLLSNVSKGSLRSSPRSNDVNKKRLEAPSTYGEIIKKKIPESHKISENVLLSQKQKNPKGLISLIWQRADLDNDKELNENELALWIHIRMLDHLDKAILDNIKTFTRHDENHDGKMSWSEFFVKFMKEIGIQKKKALELVSDYSSLSQSVKEDLALYKASWSQAEMSEPGYLNINEYLSFLHPEHNHVTIVNMVEELMTSLDEDGDDKITEEEYMSITNKADQLIPDNEWKEKRKKEFHEKMDIDKNGVIMKKELLMYVDPKNPRRANKEAKELLRKCDSNKNSKLSVNEMLDSKKVIFESKMVDVAKSLHSEF